jgi:hypothetical protein
MRAVRPEIGAIISYRFLWPYDVDRGHDATERTHPCVVLSAVEVTTEKFKVVACALTHRAKDGQVTVPVPEVLQTQGGLDGLPSYVVTNTLNSFDWPSSNVRERFPGDRTSIIWDRLPKDFLKEIELSVASERARGNVRTVDCAALHAELLQRRARLREGGRER